MSDGTYELGAYKIGAVKIMLKFAYKVLVKARCCNILCHSFVLQIPVIIKRTKMLFVCVIVAC